MKPSVGKAVVLSALVAPGAGQLYLKRFRRGVVLLAVTLLSLIGIMVSALNTAMSALQQIQQQGGMLDMSQVYKIANDSVQQSSTGHYSLFFSLIIICWLYSIFDAYIAAHKARHEDRSPTL